MARVDFLSRALEYVALGWHVVALSPGSKAPRKDSQAVHDATCDPEVVAALWGAQPDCNIAIAAGASCIVGVDVDVKHGGKGKETLQALIDKHGQLPKAPKSLTRSGGLHLWFSAAGAPKKFKKRLAGIDIIADDVMLIAPPSIVEARKVKDGIGGHYKWIRPPVGRHLPRLPTWFWKTLEPARPTRPMHSMTDKVAASGLAALARTVQTTPEGARNHLLFWAANRAAEDVALGLYTRQEAIQALGNAAQAAGLEGAEIATAMRMLAEQSDVPPTK